MKKILILFIFLLSCNQNYEKEIENLKIIIKNESFMIHVYKEKNDSLEIIIQTLINKSNYLEQELNSCYYSLDYFTRHVKK